MKHKRRDSGLILVVCLFVFCILIGVGKFFVDDCNPAPTVTESPRYIITPAPKPTEEPEPVATLEPTSTPEPTPEPIIIDVVEKLATENDIELIGRTIWGEAGGCPNLDHQAAVAWTILNRVDAGYGTIEEVITAPYQFQGYIYWEDECPEEYIEMARDVVERWEREHAGVEDVGRVLPKGYLWFRAYEGHNRFRNAYDGDYNVWGFSWESPY